MPSFFIALAFFFPAQNATPAPAPARITFTYEREGMQVPQYRIIVAEDGIARYEAIVLPRIGKGEREAVVQPVTLVAPTLTKLFLAARTANRFQTRCASKAKNIASTGAKTLSYAGPDGSGTCAYDYTENKPVEQITTIFYVIANTLDFARRLEFDHRFDRLGLDADIESFASQAKEDHMVDPALIAATLHSIADDSQLIQRVRIRAAGLLEQTPTR